jgi:hypothetical protein
MAPSPRSVQAEDASSVAKPRDAGRAPTEKSVALAPVKLAKWAVVAPPKAVVLPAFAPVVGTLDPRIRIGYEMATARAAELWPDCGMRWTILAGVGAIESANGTHHPDAVVVTDSGAILPKIVGPPLDGTGDRSFIADSDGGLVDGDSVVDHAVGPMQFLPSTWRRHGRDANDDGVADPHSIDDAALAAASYLCAAGDLRDEETLLRALFSYNHSDEYVATVRGQILRFDLEFGGLSLPDALAAPAPVPPAAPPPASTAPTSAPVPSSPATSAPAPPPSSTTTTLPRTSSPPTTVTSPTTTAPTTTLPTTSTTVAPPSTTAGVAPTSAPPLPEPSTTAPADPADR